MPIWKLEPFDPPNDNWRASSFCGPIVVRAKDKDEARGTASTQFGFWPQLAGNKIPIDPWLDPGSSSCEEIPGAKYEREGPSEVLGRL